MAAAPAQHYCRSCSRPVCRACPPSPAQLPRQVLPPLPLHSCLSYLYNPAPIIPPHPLVPALAAAPALPLPSPAHAVGSGAAAPTAAAAPSCPGRCSCAAPIQYGCRPRFHTGCRARFHSRSAAMCSSPVRTAAHVMSASRPLSCSAAAVSTFAPDPSALDPASLLTAHPPPATPLPTRPPCRSAAAVSVSVMAATPGRNSCPATPVCPPAQLPRYVEKP